MTADLTSAAQPADVTHRSRVERSAERRRGPLALALAGGCVMAVGYLISAVNIAFPAIEKQWPGTPRATLSWGIAGFTIVLAALMLPAGRMADLYGRRRVFLSGLAVIAVGSVVAMTAPWPALFIGGRLLQAAGASCILPGSLALVAPEYPDERRPWIAGSLMSLSALGQAFSPTIAAVMVDFGGWRAVFVPSLVMSAVAITIGRSVFRESARHTGGPKVDFVGVPMASFGVAMLVLAVIEGPRWGWTSRWVVAGLLGFAVLLPAFVIRSVRHPQPLLDLRLMRKHSVWASNLTMSGVGIVAQTLWFAAPLFLHDFRHFSLLRTGMALTPMPVSASTTAALAARLVHRTGPRLLAMVGTGFTAAGALWLCAVGVSDAPYVVGVVPGLAFVGAGLGLCQSSLSGLSVLDAAADEVGQANGVFHTLRYVSGSIGAAIIVAVLGNAEPIAGSSFRRAFAVQAGFVVAAFVLASTILPRTSAGRSRAPRRAERRRP